MSPPRTLLPLAALFALFASTTAAAVEPSTLEQRMSPDEFTSAGLDRLTPEQLRFLNDWLGNKGIVASVAPLKKRDGTLEYYPDDSDRELIESRIVGPFEGWRGKTVVTLENGQKWQQSESGSRGDVNMTGPAVTIKPMSMGSWLIVVKGCNCSVRVRRIG
ncbi:MAG: hypothetical protein J0L88_12195 [Xanthomonadales bacterium]|nr:hypothetical protein [Xanthomonadales bacterium]